MADPANPQELGPGFLVANTYRIKRLLGKGGMGEVWEAEHTRLAGKRVAIKVLISEVAQEEEALARFHREAQIAAGLGHSNIVVVEDYNALPDGKPYIVLEYLDGESLDARLERGALPIAQSMRILRQVGSALRAAHQAQVIHRDLKPQNVFLCEREEEGEMKVVAKVLDFGISKILASQTVKTQTSTVLGTPQYMAPEQATGKHELVDARTDIFCLGIMAYEMLAGAPPFTGQTVPEVVFKIVYEPETPLAQIAPSVPKNVADAVHKALSKDQSDRFSSVGDFIEALTGRPLATGARTAPPRSAAHAQAVAATVASDNISGLEIAASTEQDIANSATMHASSANQSLVVDAPKAKSKPWLLIALAVLLLGGGGVAATVLMGGSDESAEKTATAETKKARPTGSASSKAPTQENSGAPKKSASKDDSPKKVDTVVDAEEKTTGSQASTEEKKDDPKKPSSKDVRPAKVSQPKKASASSSGAKDRDRQEAGSVAGGTSSDAPPEPATQQPADVPRPAEERMVPPPDRSLAKIFGARQVLRFNPKLRFELRQAADAVVRKQWMRAAQAANVANRRGAGQPALVLKTMAACGRRDLTTANTTYRRISSKAYRKKLHSFCRKYQMVLQGLP